MWFRDGRGAPSSTTGRPARGAASSTSDRPARSALLDQRQNQFIGLVVRPLTITEKCRWQPVDQPVVPTYPMT